VRLRRGAATGLIGIFLLVASCSVETGSGNSGTESRPVSGFSNVELAGSGELVIEQTGTESLTIEADDNLLPLLTSEVSGDTLLLGVKPNTTLRPRQPITYRLTVQQLTGLEISGSGNVTASKLETTRLRVEISGSGRVTPTGSATDQELEISGSGEYQAEDLVSKTLRAQISGSGNAVVSVAESIDVEISGSGSLTYEGDPRISQEISGSGKLIKR
jgi:Putative auto-transporter adhesin, head GIN domain